MVHVLGALWGCRVTLLCPKRHKTAGIGSLEPCQPLEVSGCVPGFSDEEQSFLDVPPEIEPQHNRDKTLTLKHLLAC